MLCECCAHKSQLAVMAWSHNGQLLATASTKGTVIRVHSLRCGVSVLFAFVVTAVGCSVVCLSGRGRVCGVMVCAMS